MQEYNRFIENYGSSSAGLQARQVLGSLYMQTGDLAKAEEIFRELTKTSGADKDLLAVAWGALAQCLESAGKTSDAVDAYAKAASFSGGHSANLWRSDQARLLMANDKPAALTVYEQIWKTSFNNYLHFMAGRMLLDLGVKPSTGASS